MAQPKKSATTSTTRQRTSPRPQRDTKPAERASVPTVSRWLVLAVIAVAGLVGYATYSHSLSFPFVYDDYHAVVMTPLNKSLETFIDNVGLGNRRYLTTLSFLATGQVSQGTPNGHRIVSLLSHAINSALVTFLALAYLRLLTTPTGGELTKRHLLVAGAAGLAFALHPVNIQAVVYIAQRSTVLSTLGYLSLLAIHASTFRIRGHSSFSPGNPRYWIALAIAVLFMFTKEIFFTAPLAMIVADFFLCGKSPQDWFRERAKVLAPFLLPLIILPALVSTFSESAKAEVFAVTSRSSLLSPLAYFMEQIRSYEVYARLVVFPLGQRLLYSTGSTSPLGSWQFYCGLAIVGGLGYAAFRAWKSAPLIAMGLILMTLGVLIEFTVVPIKDLIQEHRLYLPLTGVLFAVCGLVVRSGKIGISVLVAILPVFLVMTQSRLKDWSSAEALWRDNVQKEPTLAVPLLGLGQAYSEMGDNTRAMAIYRKASELDPNSDVALANVGIITFLQKGPADTSIAWMTRALYAGLAPEDSLKLNIFLAGGRPDSLSGPNIARALEYSWAKRKAFEGLGLVLNSTKQYERAAHLMKAQATIRGKDPTLWNNLAAVYLSLGKKRLGLQYLDSALKYGYPLQMDSYYRVKQDVASDTTQQ